MARKRRKYSSEFKAEAVKLVLEQEMSATQAAKDLGIAQSVLSLWVARAREEASPGALAAAEREELRKLRRENNILRQPRHPNKSRGLLRGGDVVASYRFILAEEAIGTWSVRRMCSALHVHRSGYYAWRDRGAALHTREDARLAVHIKAIHRRSRGTAGRAEGLALQDEGMNVV